MSNDRRADNLLDQINATIPATDFESEYFPGGMIKVTITLTAELAERVQELARRAGWPPADAYVATLASGIGAFEEARAREIQFDGSQAAKDEIDLLIKQMRQMEVQYAVMKARTWNYLQAYQSAVLSRGALENRASGLDAVVARLRAEAELLREEVNRLRTTTQGLPGPAAPPPPEQAQTPTLRQRMGLAPKDR